MKRSEYDGNFAMPAIIICTISVSRVGKSVIQEVLRLIWNMYLFIWIKGYELGTRISRSLGSSTNFISQFLNQSEQVWFNFCYLLLIIKWLNVIIGWNGDISCQIWWTAECLKWWVSNSLETCLNITEILWEIHYFIRIYADVFTICFLGKIDHLQKSSRHFTNPIDITYKWRFGY